MSVGSLMHRREAKGFSLSWLVTAAEGPLQGTVPVNPAPSPQSFMPWPFRCNGKFVFVTSLHWFSKAFCFVVMETALSLHTHISSAFPLLCHVITKVNKGRELLWAQPSPASSC